MTPVGAPPATGMYEEISVMGLEKLVMFGACGVLDRNIQDLAIVIPTSAIFPAVFAVIRIFVIVSCCQRESKRNLYVI